MLLSIVLCLSKSQAQNNTFMYTFKDWGAFDIQEDNKNGFFLIKGYNSARININGEILWEYSSGSYLIGENGHDSHNIYFFGAPTSFGGFEFIRTNYQGQIIKQTIHLNPNEGDSNITPFDVIYDNNQRLFIVCGVKHKLGSSMGQFWISGVDMNGNIVWQNSFFDRGKSRHFKRILPNKSTGGYFLLGTSILDYDYSEIFTTDSLGHLISRNYVDSCYDANYLTYLKEIVDISPFQDSLFLVSGRTSCKRELNYYIIDQYGKTKQKIISRYNFEIQLPLQNGNFLIAYGDQMALLDQNFNHIWIREKLFGERLHFNYEIKSVHQSKDGGFYGVAEGIAPSGEDNLVFVFKTDRDGLIHPQNKYSEWDQPLMLIPNPASKKVRIAIPYYYGQIEAHFFDSKGNLISKQTQNDTDLFDIQHLSPGMYFVKAVILNTQESRTMKLIVQ